MNNPKPLRSVLQTEVSTTLSAQASTWNNPAEAAKFDDSEYISPFVGNCATEKEIAACVAKIGAAFPWLQDTFLLLLANEFKYCHYNNERLKAITRNTIRNCKGWGGRLTVADIMEQDVRLKTYTFAQVYTKYGQWPHHDFARVWQGDERKYVLREEAEKYGLSHDVWAKDNTGWQHVTGV